MKRRDEKKKLSVKKQRLQPLDERSLAAVQGGAMMPSGGCATSACNAPKA